MPLLKEFFGNDVARTIECWPEVHPTWGNLQGDIREQLGYLIGGAIRHQSSLAIACRQPRRKRSPAPLSRAFFYMEVGRGRFQRQPVM
jgi:hypothetical protein